MRFNLEKDIKNPSFKKSWRIYENSFPEDERRNLLQQEKLLNKKGYSFYSIEDKKEIIGLLATWKLDKYFFIEHFAIKEDFRNKGLGQKIIEKYLKSINAFAVLETERPEANQMAERRIGFWERSGFILNKYNYIQPSYSADKKPVPLFLMSYPQKLNKSEFENIRNKIHLNVYGCKKPILSL
jgi:ribosomal protein S18 acetylase RimI-like enzyme